LKQKSRKGLQLDDVKNKFYQMLELWSKAKRELEQVILQ
jgi:hypothetical protein